MRVTLQQIADETGLSKPTVSRILNASCGQYRPETQARVRQAAERLGYRPNSAAKAVANGRFNAAALVLSMTPQFSNVPPGLIDGIHDALAAHGMHLTLSRMDDQRLSSENVLPKVLRELMVDGMLINYTDNAPPHLADLVRQMSIPAVWINRRMETDAVYPDDEGAGYMATRHLLDLGHRSIVYLDQWHQQIVGQHWHYSVLDRQHGYERAMAEFQAPARVVRGRGDIRYRVGMVAQLLRESQRPTGLVMYSADVAPMLAAAELGLTVPDQLSVVALSDAPSKDGLTIFVNSCGKMGSLAVEILRKKLADPSPVPACSVPFVLVPGNTAAAVAVA
jgi:LacI family transcriptional regulator